MTDILAQVLERVARRRERWSTSTEEILPHPSALGEVVIVGSFSLCGMSSRRRILLKDQCISTPLGLETPSSLARDYLVVKYRRSPPASHAQILELRRSMTRPPIYAKPCVFPEGYYVDIRAAFFSILSVIGWDLDYWPARWLSPGAAPVDFPWPEHKIARNCLVSTGMSTPTTLYIPGAEGRPGFFKSITQGNALANIQLFRAIMDILSAIGAEAVSAGAVYVHTDGFIAPNYETLSRLIDIISAWGLEARIKQHGAGMVEGPGTYAIGAARSKRKVLSPRPVHSIAEVAYADWLRGKFAGIKSLRERGAVKDRAQSYTPPHTHKDKENEKGPSESKGRKQA